MMTVNVNAENGQYSIIIGPNILNHQPLPIVGDEVLIVTNETVAKHYLLGLKVRLADINCETVILPDGEQYKTLETVNLIFDALIHANFSRKVTLIALGGGVIGDMTGFAAACYQRGVAFIQIPTTLLAQVDSAVGGKTAVNHRLSKNMIGAFHQPITVISDITTLKTLPKREFAAGFAEMLKYGLIWDADFFYYLYENQQALFQQDPQVLMNAIGRSCEIKAEIVQADPKEAGIRAILNFGHTFAHAIEHIMGYGTLLHGEAVAIGMCIATRLSVKLGFVDELLLMQLINILQRANLPVHLPPSCTPSAMFEAMSHDKKKVAKQLRFIILTGLGHAKIWSDDSMAVVEAVMAESYA